MARLLLLVTFFLLGFGQVSWGQFTDNFSDGNFTANPAWSGNTSIYTIVGGELRNNDTGAGESYLSTSSTATDEWEFYVRLGFNPSSSNLVKIYLMSDQADLTSTTLNGYYIRIGETGSNDGIDLYRQTGTTDIKIIDGPNGQVATNPTVRIKVTRSNTSDWTVTANLRGNATFDTNIGSVNDNTHTTSTHFGVFCKYSSTRRDLIFFDDFDVKDTSPPTIATAEGTSAHTLDITFSEEVDQTTAETTTNYSVNNSVGNPTTATRDGSDPKIVRLTFGSNFSVTQQNTVTVQNVQDLNSNVMMTQNINFTVDVTPPTIASVKVLSATAIDITFSENVDQSTAEIATNYSLNNSIGNPASAAQDATNKALVHLIFGTAFVDLTNYTLTIQNVSDTRSNVMSTATRNFQYLGPYTPNSRDIVINEIFADPDTQVGSLPNAEFVELYNATNRPIDITGWKLEGANTGGFPADTLLAGSYVILTNPTNVGQFTGNVLSWGGTGALTNSGETLTLKNNADVVVDQVTYTTDWYNDASKASGGYSLEQINPNTPCTGRNNWSVSNATAGGTPGTQNSIFNVTSDQTAPQISSFSLSNDSLIIQFSEAIDSVKLRALGNYSADKGLTISSVTATNPSFEEVKITFTNALQTGTVYTLTLSNLTDCIGNALSNNTTRFGKGVAPGYQELIITEIMADPTPVVGLPNREFIEVFNRSNKVLELSTVQLSDDAATIPLGQLAILPGEYVILTSNTGASDLNSFGKTLGVTNFPSLTNAGELLILRNASGQLINSVSYTDSWYQSDAKKDGGYTLEIIDTDNFCGSANNWRASNSNTGGTPGQENSIKAVNPDTSSPLIALTQVVNDSTLVITFNETMDSTQLQTLTNYRINNNLLIQSVTTSIPYNTVTLRFTPGLQVGTSYTLTAINLVDCANNLLTSNTSTFGKGSTPAYHELIITEIMADPTPEVNLPDREFIEIFNRSNKILDLNQITLTDGSSTAVLGQLSVLPGEYVILTTTTGVNDLGGFGKALGIIGFPSLANGGELLALRNTNGQLLHSVRYADTWYQDDAKKDGGYTLEMIDTDNPCGEIDNWRAATATAGGTPGKENSVKAVNPDQNAPILLKAEALTANTVTVTFNEKMDSTSLANATYTLSNGASIQNINLASPDFKVAQLKAMTTLQTKTVYTLTVNNARDCSGNAIGTSNTARFALAEQGDSLDIVLNEVLFNPRTGGVDFVEIYNNSDKYVNLKDWQLGNVDSDGNIANLKPLTNENSVLAPKNYQVLTTNQANIQMNYPRAPDSTFLVMATLPGYNDSEGSVILLNNQGLLMERFDYKEDFHFPLIDDKNGVSLERISFTAPVNNQNSWQSAASTVGFATPGLPNSQQSRVVGGGENITLDSQVITPNGDGDRDFVTINYKFAQSGITVNMTIFDKRGQQVKRLVQNDLAATEGFYTWDGTNDSGQRVRMGYYIIFVETFDLNGNKERFKKPVVVGARF